MTQTMSQQDNGGAGIQSQTIHSSMLQRQGHLAWGQGSVLCVATLIPDCPL